MKCELLLWLVPLMSTLFLFLLSNPTLGSREPPVSFPSADLVKHDHTATRSLTSTRWPVTTPQPPSCKKRLVHTQLDFRSYFLGNLNAASISMGHRRSNFYLAGGARGMKDKRVWAWEPTDRRQRGAVNKRGLSLTGLLEAPRHRALICDDVISTIPLGNIWKHIHTQVLWGEVKCLFIWRAE